jgi:hypothetical protein
MHDDFLHRLRKEPRPEFAARLQAQLRRQSRSSLGSGPPSWVRTVVTLLLLGGTAFAFTGAVMRGFPTSWIELSRHTVIRMIAERTTAREGRQHDDGGVRQGLGLYARESGSGDGAAVPGGPVHDAMSTASAPTTAATPAGAATGSSLGRGVPSGFRGAQLKVATSWSAYLYVQPLAKRMNRMRGANGMPNGEQIGVSVRDSDRWPGPMCGNDAHAPDIAYAFAPSGTVSDRPCDRNAPPDTSPVVAIPVAHEAVALARSPLYGAPDLTRREVFLALAKWVPDTGDRKVHANTNTTWRQIDAALGPEPIEFMGPPLSSAAGRSMIELLMEAGCKTIPWVAALESTDPDRYAHICRAVRSDGVYVELSSLAPYRLLSEPNAVGIFGLNGDWPHQLKDLAVSRLDGEAPTPQSIDSGAYPGSRTLYLYVKRGDVAPNVLFGLLPNEEFEFFYPNSAFVEPTEAEFRAAESMALTH